MGVVDTLRIVYEVDVRDRGTKMLATSQARAQRGVAQVSRALSAQDAALRRSTSTAARHSTVVTRQARSSRAAATHVARLTRAQRAAASEMNRAASATQRVVGANNQLAVSARRAETAAARQRRTAAKGPGIGARTASRARGATAGVLGGFGAVAAVRFVAQETAEAARQQKVIAQGIKSTGGAANVTAAHIERMTGAMSRQAGIDDEVIGKGASVILTFTKIRNEVGKGNQVFDRANQAALDLSVRFGKDLTSTSLQVGKALNDPVKGITALSRAGIQFTKQQKAQIATMVESGDTLGAQKLILRELETQVGGSAKANALPMDRLKVSVANLAEAIGTELEPSVNKAAGKTADFIDQILTGTGAGGRFRAGVVQTARDLKPLGQGLASVGKFLAQHPRLIMGIVGAYGTLRAVRFGAGVVRQISAITTAAAKSRIATHLASGASGAGTKIRRALSGVKGIIENVMRSAGRGGGAVAASNIASTAGANIGPALDRRQKMFSGGRWTKLGRIAGKAMGVGVVAGLALMVPAITEKLYDLLNVKKGTPTGAGQAIWNAIRGKRRGGIVERVRRYQAGGLVPIAAAGGEMLVDGGRATMIGGATDRDGTLMLARPGSAVLTGDGQARMAMGASLTQAVRDQAPHFRQGGRVDAFGIRRGAQAARFNRPDLLWGVYGQESNYGRNLGPSSAGARGPFQFMPATARQYGIDPMNFAQAARAAAQYLRTYQRRGIAGMLAAYNAGPAARPPYPAETRSYIPGVISKARTYPLGRGKSRTASGDGPGDRTARAPIMLGRSRRRAGLIADAAEQGRAAGQAGITRSIIRREGNPILAAIREATSSASVTAEARQGTGASARERERRPRTPPGGGGTRGSLQAAMRLSRSSGLTITSTTGGRHAPNSWHYKGRAFDAAGTPGQMRAYAIATAKRWRSSILELFHDPLGWYVKNGRRVSGSIGGHGRHVHTAMRRGGIIGRYRPGGFVAGQGSVAGSGAGRGLTGALGTAMTFAGGSLEALDNLIGKSLQQRLVALREQVQARVRKGGPAKVVQRLQGVLDMIDFELGRRVGRIQDIVEQRSRQLDRRRADFDRGQRARGVDPGSVQGVTETAAFQQVETAVRKQNVASLESALRRAAQSKNRDAIREITAQLEDAQDALGESIVAQIELARQAAEALRQAALEADEALRQAVADDAQRIVDTYTSQSTMADLGLQRLELEQRLIGTSGSAGGAQGRADYIRQQIIPAIQAEIAALQLQQQVAQGQSNADLVRQLNEQIFGRQNDILQRQLDAQEQTAENTEALKEFGGSNAFSYRDQLFTDLDVIRSRLGA